MWSPLREPLDWERTAGLQLMAEVLEEALPELAIDDAVFRLAATVLPELQMGCAALPVSYFCLWMTRLMGWMPELRACTACGLDLRDQAVWWSAAVDGVVCEDDRQPGSVRLEPEAVREVQRIFRSGLAELTAERWPRSRTEPLLRLGAGLLERHLQRRLRSATVLLERVSAIHPA